jgi:glutamyl-tRNA synthetase
VTVRTRFAPSPTGFLHMGSARTALFNWAFARRHGGQFVLRIEDTDAERSTRESEEALIDGLRWLGLDWDEGPYRQSERRDRYAAAVEELLARGQAYRCVCTPAELADRKEAAIAAGRSWTYDGRCRDRDLGPDCGPHAVRLRLPRESRFEWNDLVFGPSGLDAAELGDLIVRRSDGQPLYNLAVVVDDVEMAITHVIRGADHHINTAFQIAIYRALEKPVPLFAHVPLIVGPGGKKLSKRRDPVSVQRYREDGYLPEAVLNWLVRIGWSHGDQEIFSVEEIQSLFGLEAVSRSSAQADVAKLQWLNLHYTKALPRERLVEELRPFLERAVGHPVDPTPELGRLVDLLRERSRTLVEMAEGARFLATDQIPYEEKAVAKHMRPEALPPLVDLHDRLAAIDEWTEGALEAAFDEVRARHDDLPVGRLAQPVRIAITGRAASPGIFETLAVLGKRRAVGRIAEAIHFLRHGG